MSDKRRWCRVAPSGLVPRNAKILLGPGTDPIDCLVVDLSAGGACLELPRDYKLPDKFDFLHGRSRRTSYLVWRSGFRIGLSYEGLKTRSGISDGLSRSSGLSRLSRGR